MVARVKSLQYGLRVGSKNEELAARMKKSGQQGWRVWSKEYKLAAKIKRKAAKMKSWQQG